MIYIGYDLVLLFVLFCYVYTGIIHDMVIQWPILVITIGMAIYKVLEHGGDSYGGKY